MAKELTQQEEGQLLAALLGDRNRAQFARDFCVPGGGSMISQNTSGTRPISLDGAVAYARGLGVPISAFSPRLAKMIEGALVGLASSENPLLIQEHSSGNTSTRAPVVAWALLGDVLSKPTDDWPVEATREIPATKRASRRTLWLEVNDDLLAPRVLKGDLVAVDLDGLPSMDTLVLARAVDGTYMLRFWRPLIGGAFEVLDGAGRAMDSVRHGVEVIATFVTLQRDNV